MKGLDTKIYDVVCISPRNHMVFTPLLASTCVGTLEFRSVAEPVNRIQPALASAPDSYFYLASCLGVPEEEKKRLLHCVVIGGGPTGVEFSGELSDFIGKDVRERFSHVKDDIKVTLIEANEILSSFDVGLRQYASNHLRKSGVKLMRGVVKEVHPNKIVLNDGTDVPYGLLVWSTGVGPSQFVKSLALPKSPGGRIGVDEYLRVPSAPDVFAMGDCAGFLESTGKPVLPALAQVAERQGKYLVELFNKRMGKQNGGKATTAGGENDGGVLGDPFVYKHMGSMATVGRYKALVDLRQSKDAKGLSMAGFLSWLIWRSAYLTRVVSWRNRFYVAVNWATTFVFGRDSSRI
ncbi:Internal alternative NAD(P)H-ubiquinone oxidoreductase A1, mitochondrial [Linum grandiflorum]